MRCSISGKLNPTPRFFESASIGLHSWFNPPSRGSTPNLSRFFLHKSGLLGLGIRLDAVKRTY